MSDAYQDPFEAFRKKQEKKQEEQSIDPQAQTWEKDSPKKEVRPPGFTTSRHTREDLVPKPPEPAPPPEPPPLQESINEALGGAGKEEQLGGARPEGFLDHKYAKEKKKLSPDEIKKPKGFTSHKFE